MIRLLPIVAMLFSGICGTMFHSFRIAKCGTVISTLGIGLILLAPNKIVEFQWFSIEKIIAGFCFEFSTVGSLICLTAATVLSCLYYARKIELSDQTINKKMGILNIFIFFMCIAVFAKNLLQFYVGLEALGIISTILVGIEKKSELQASRVYLFNKFASVLFLFAIVLIAIKTGSFDFDVVKTVFSHKNADGLFFPACLLLISCFCKGAQLPFSYWLIDAIRANIFASILIHTGTLVVIGIIFITKCYFIFDCFPILQKLMLAVGLYTAFWMSSCSVSHNNIKKIMACLTASSAGIMFMSCGIGAYSLAILYLLCHAFFKSILFLSFAYLIAAMSKECNILRMGGVSKFVPKITDVIWVSFLSAVGFPFLAGFFAKISFIGAIRLSDMSFMSVSSVIVNIIATAALFRLVLVSLYGQSSSDDLTLSRSSTANAYDMTPIWGLIALSVFGSFVVWSIYEWGELHFGKAGIVYARNVMNYFMDNLVEMGQVLVSMIIVFLFSKFTKTRYSASISSACVAIFRRNEFYELISNKVIKRTVLFFMRFFNDINEKMSSFINNSLFISAYSIGGTIAKKHKRLFFAHTNWIIWGIIAMLSTVLLGIYVNV